MPNESDAEIDLSIADNDES